MYFTPEFPDPSNPAPQQRAVKPETKRSLQLQLPPSPASTELSQHWQSGRILLLSKNQGGISLIRARLRQCK